MIAGKYVLDRLLGQGGMGAVFAARHLKLAKSVAIKIMLADAGNPEASQRFINEGRAAANIQNEHVVRVDDVDEEMGYAYMVLELLEGQDLAQILEASPGKRIAPHLAVSYVMQGLKGVAQAHALGIVHRDLKPSNLFLAKRKDGSAVVKVLDFGISKATGQGGLNAAPNALTSTKAMLGSPLYMSPEQLRNAKGVDHRADIWAMGVILYELITGALPFMGDNLGELFANILESDPLPLRQRAGDAVPLGLNDVVMRCLQRKPEQRFQSAAELMQALAPFEHAGVVGAIGAGTNVGLGALGGTAFLPNASLQTGQQGAATRRARALRGGHRAAAAAADARSHGQPVEPHAAAVRADHGQRLAAGSRPSPGCRSRGRPHPRRVRRRRAHRLDPRHRGVEGLDPSEGGSHRGASAAPRVVLAHRRRAPRVDEARRSAAARERLRADARGQRARARTRAVAASYAGASSNGHAPAAAAAAAARRPAGSGAAAEASDQAWSAVARRQPLISPVESMLVYKGADEGT